MSDLGWTLEGASIGIKYFIYPNLSKLSQISVSKIKIIYMKYLTKLFTFKGLV